MALSAYADNKLIDHLLGSGTFTKPSSLYLALTVSGTEVSGGAYARQAIAFSISGGVATSTTDVLYAIATANWGTIDGIAVYDASSGGNQLLAGTLTASKTINSGDRFELPTGNLTVTLA